MLYVVLLCTMMHKQPFYLPYLRLSVSHPIGYINGAVLSYSSFKASYAINHINPVKGLAANLSSIAVFHA